MSASTVLATEITEHTNDMVAEENHMSSDDLISTGDYSDYDILDEEKDLISENDLVWVKTKKRNMKRKSTVNSLQQKQRRSWIFENKMDGYTERG